MRVSKEEKLKSLTFSYPPRGYNGVFQHNHNTVQETVYLFGKQKCLLEHLGEIAKKISRRESYLSREIGISRNGRMCLKDFIL